MENEKISKREADYRKADIPEERCRLCSMFEEPHGCTYVEGKINPEYVCDYFHRR